MHVNHHLWDMDNIIVGLECDDRVRDVDLKRVASSQL